MTAPTVQPGPTGFPLSTQSLERLHGVHPDLQRVIARAAQLLPFPLTVLEGVRTEQRQAELYAIGRTKPGKIVTATMDSRHRVQKCGYGCAVDLAKREADGSIDWNNTRNFLIIGKAMFAAAAELHVPIRWGYDWDGDGITQEHGEYDGPHHELQRKAYP